MANRKQQREAEISESVQRVAEASKPAPKPVVKAPFSLHPKKNAENAVRPNPRSKADQANRAAELTNAAEEARMQGQAALDAQKETSKSLRKSTPSSVKPALRRQAKNAQAQRTKSYAPEAPANPVKENRIKKLIKEGKVKPLTTREEGKDLTGTGGQVLKNKKGEKLKGFGDYSNWKRKSTDPKITRKGRK
jgi:DNA primase